MLRGSYCEEGILVVLAHISLFPVPALSPLDYAERVDPDVPNFKQSGHGMASEKVFDEPPEASKLLPAIRLG